MDILNIGLIKSIILSLPDSEAAKAIKAAEEAAASAQYAKDEVDNLKSVIAEVLSFRINSNGELEYIIEEQ